VELVEAACKVYEEHPLAYHQFPVDEITFSVGEHFVSGGAHPHMHFEGEEFSGIRHVTPWSVVSYATFGEKGTLGQASKFANSGYVTDPMDAVQQINLCDMDYVDRQAVNANMQSYFEWLEELRQKYIDHLTDNIESYDILMKRLQILFKNADRATLREMIQQICTPVTRTIPEENTETLNFRQKLYFNQRDQGRKPLIRCDLDEDMWNQGAVRKHIPLFDSEGVEIPLATASIGSGDIVSVENNIVCQLYDVGGNIGAGLKRNTRAVVLIHQEPRGGQSYQSPYQQSIPGGLVYQAPRD